MQKQIVEKIEHNTEVGDGKSPSLDLVWGAEPIGKVIGLNKRQTFHLLESGRLPAKKVGGKWVSSEGALRRHFCEVLTAEVA